MEPKRAPERCPSGSSQTSKNALFSLCFRTKPAPPGSQKVAPTGARDESKKGSRKEPNVSSTEPCECGLAKKPERTCQLWSCKSQVAGIVIFRIETGALARISTECQCGLAKETSQPSAKRTGACRQWDSSIWQDSLFFKIRYCTGFTTRYERSRGGGAVLRRPSVRRACTVQGGFGCGTQKGNPLACHRTIPTRTVLQVDPPIVGGSGRE